jgi:hypothetical protein
MREESPLVLRATQVTRVTLVGFIIQDYPSPRGNCFSMEAQDGEQYRILNFNHENLEKLLEEGKVDFPLDLHKLGEGVALLADPRIPDEWYARELCTTCTPRHLLSHPQKLRKHLQIQRGERTETVVEIDGKKMIVTTVKVEPKAGPVRVPWTIAESNNVVINDATQNSTQM